MYSMMKLYLFLLMKHLFAAEFLEELLRYQQGEGVSGS